MGLRQEMLRLGPFSGVAFVFRSKRTGRIKILPWDRTGLVLVTNASPAMSAALFEGLEWRLVRPEEARRPQAAG
ncbi:IS66 family insertion sequence element accessory protein TnpB [Bradyrhizobium yuanmingense]|uniref:IS66 family insertion sequence element accessory protein TnpB n=1 Tax=Bradyrhizobium yuanmingense TaxID=108015 RepID=UPI003512C626